MSFMDSRERGATTHRQKKANHQKPRGQTLLDSRLQQKRHQPRLTWPETHPTWGRKLETRGAHRHQLSSTQDLRLQHQTTPSSCHHHGSTEEEAAELHRKKQATNPQI